MIKDFHFNITDYDVKLDKLYEDAKKGSNVVSTNVQDVGNKVLAKPSGNVNSYGGTSSSDLEFVDFDNRVSGNKGNPSTITNSLNSNNNINSNNANVNGTTSSLNNNSNGNLTSSQGNTTLNNGITGTSTSKIDTSSNSSFTGASTTGINGSSQNGKDDNDFGFSGTNTSGVGNKTDSNVNNLNLNVDTDIDISTSIKNNLENASATVTSTSYLSNTTVPEEDLSDYIARLRKYGLTEEDINKIINGKASLEEIIAEIDSSIEDGRKGKMLEAAYLQACEIGFDSMDELDAAINKEKEKIAKYQEELKTVDNHEIEALMQIVIQVKQGNDLQSVLNNTIVAYKYTDSDGKTAYVYENPYDNGVAASEIDYEALTFEEMYPDSTDLKELEKVISTYGMWIESPEQVEFFNNLNSSYSNKQTSNTNTAKDINAKIAECESTIATYNGYKEFITGEVDYYLEYIHPYINSADFATNNSPSDKYAQTIDNILSKYQNVQTYDYNTNPPTEYINSKEDIVNVVGAMINGDVTLSGGYVVTPTALVAIESNELTLKHFEEWLPFITEEEKQIFNYIYNTQGIDATYDYIQGISSNLDQRWLADKTQSDQEFASEHPVLASVGSIVLTPIEGISAISYSINSYLRDIKISRTDVYSSGDVWRGTVANDIAQNYGEGWSFLYSTSMSIADSAALIAANLATGGIAAPALTAYIMGARVYVSTINDALDRGLSDGSAIALAFSSAVVESAMESYSLSHLLNLEKTFANSTLNITEYVGSQITDPKLAAIATKSAYIFGSAINQAIVEGEEEFSTEIFDYVLDELIAGDLSNHSLTIQRYLDLGYSEEEARNRANNELMNQATLAFLGGFLSGTLFGSLSAVQSTRVTSKRIANSIYEQFNNSGVKLSDTIASLEASNPSVATDLKTILDTLKSKYGTEELSLKVIRDYLDTGEVSILPTENNVQQLIQKYSIDELRTYFNIPDTSYSETNPNDVKASDISADIKMILDTIKSKYNSEELSLKIMRDYLDTGEVSILPTENNVQQLIQKYSIDEIRAYLNMPDTSYKEQTTTEDSLFVSELSSLYPRTTVTQEQLNKLYNDYKAGKVVINSVREILLKSYPSGDFVAQKGNMIAIYEHLRDWGFTEAQAEKLISDAWRGIINERGFDVYGINVNGIDININVQKDMDYTNQDMTLEKLQSELEKIPKYLLKPLKNVYVYDMVGPRELQNAIKYKLPNSFASASANNNRINFHPLGKPHDFSVIYHELAHVYDRSYGELWGAYGENVSSSEVWQEAEKADRAISNIFGVSNYANLTQSPVEDFAESVAFYYTNPEIMRQFPNRLNVLRKYLTLSENVDISQYGKPVTISGKISKDLAHNLKIVLENLREKYNNSETTVKKVLSKVFQTGDLSLIPRANGARNIMSFYNLSDIAQALGFNNINVGSAKVANEIKVKPVENQINDNRLVARSTNPSLNADINSAINTMITKYGKVADVNELIEQYLLTGNINLITRTNNARDLISKYSKNDIAQALGLTQYIKVEQQAKVKQPVNLERNLQVIIDTLHKAYGTPQVVADKINTYLDTGDLSLIPSTNNARELIQNISLNELRNKLKGTNLDTSQNIQKDMQTLVDTLSLKYNGEYSVSYILEQYLKTGKLNKITRTNNLRTLIQKYSINDLKEYFDIYDEDLYISFDIVKPYSEDKLKFKGISNIVNDFQSIIETLKTKLGSYQAAFNKFIDYLKNGDSAVIPLDNGARNTILKYSIEDLKNNFDILKNKVRTTMDDIKVRIDKIMNGIQPYFEYNRIPINFDIMFPSEFYKEPLRGHIVTEPKEEEILVDKDKLYDKQEEIYDTLEEIKDTPSPTQTVVTPEDNIQISDEDLLLLVKRTIRGDFGNGQERIDKLGRIYDLVQNQVNLNLDHGNTMWDNIQLYK